MNLWWKWSVEENQTKELDLPICANEEADAEQLL